jgi:hypothetical protein
MTTTDLSLATLADKIAIRELTATYNRAVDDGRIEDAFATFVDGAGSLEIKGMGAMTGDELRALFSALAGIVHATTDAIIEVDGDRARQLCTLLVLVRAPEGGVVRLVTTGRYEDDVERTAQGWRFLRRFATLDRNVEDVVAIGVHGKIELA